VTIRDDGRGFSGEAPNPSRHLGIEGMRQRASSLGGNLQIVSRTGGGTQVRLQIPNRSLTRGTSITA